jgi:rubrerythrin
MKTPKQIYERFIGFEEEAAAIYVQMAARFSPDNMELSSLWLDMGMQEKQHAGLLQFCLAEQLFSSNLPSEPEIESAENLFNELTAQAADPGLSVDAAFGIAAKLEASEVNAIYDRLTTPAHASMYLLRKKIASSVPDHVQQLARAARQFSVRKETEQELDRLAEKQAQSQMSTQL